VSRPELADVQLPQNCDVIWVGALFTHVDRDRTERWLRHLCRSLSADGVLVATFHGPWSIKVHERHPMIDPECWGQIMAGYTATGYGYARYKYMQADFGVSLSDPTVVIDMVMSIPGVRLLSYTERGWADNHDVLGVLGTDRLKPW
jgi:hypothetical protein